MPLRVGEAVMFGPPGTAKIRGLVMRAGTNTARVQQVGAGHGKPSGTEWNVPLEFIKTFAKEPKPKRTSRREPKPKEPKRTSRRVQSPPARTSSAPLAPGHAPRSGDLATHRDTIDFAHELLRQWAIPNYHVNFSGKFTSRMGQCNFLHREITFSTPLWPLATPEQRRNTTIHEVAHAVTRDRHGAAVAAHGREWAAQMVAMGAPPKSRHNIDTSSVKRKRADTVAMVCCGGSPTQITLKRAHRLVTMRGTCKACSQPPVFASASDRKKYEDWLSDTLSSSLKIRPNSCRCGAHSLECGLVLR